jgi:hypothetical protein
LCGVRGPPRPARCSQSACPFPALFLCDYPIGKGRTCSARVCSTHRRPSGAADHCPRHAGALTLPGVR